MFGGEKMKKYLVLLLLLLSILIATQSTVIFAAGTYTDVPENAWYSYPVNVMSEEGIMIGDKTGFHPNNYLTGAQAAQIVVNLNRQYKTAIEIDNKIKITSNLYKTEHRFSFNKDLQKHWSAESVNLVINKMAKNGYSFDSYQENPMPFSMVTGDSASGKVIEFKPEKAITRAEFAAMILFGFLENEIQDSKSNQDAINKIIKLGILQGYPNGKFKENNPITRAEAAVVCIRARDVSRNWYIDAYC